ncbi:alpha/beta fold hydrolase [Minwuia sp.]|uniref:alpha/beta fold hydrolase n=1 Tax=Minwuia sp. TaxID=2493630 RepID=UPI003A909E3A
MLVKHIEAGVLDVAYREYGQSDGWPVILCHGFPYDAEVYADSAPMLAEAGARVLVPYLRGYGPTRFLSDETPRSGEQAVLGNDLKQFMDALGIGKAVLGGYDWGGRACCIVSALWPERATALVTGNSYNIHDVARSMNPVPPKYEAAFWYQYYFQIERGRNGLTQNRRDLVRYIWQTWSPTWAFDDATFEASAASFDNPDFVDVVIHSYRVRYGLAEGDPAVAEIETALAQQPEIAVPTICIDGDSSGLFDHTRSHAKKFTGPYAYRTFAGAGHNLPQESPKDWAQAVIDARDMAG